MTFLNVDLDLFADEDLSPLLSALAPRTFSLHAETSATRSEVHLELDGEPASADSGIASFVRLVMELPPDARALWDRARRKELNIGIDAPETRGPFELALEPGTLAQAASVGARVVVTVYGPTEDAS